MTQATTANPSLLTIGKETMYFISLKFLGHTQKILAFSKQQPRRHEIYFHCTHSPDFCNYYHPFRRGGRSSLLLKEQQLFKFFCFFPLS